MFIKFLFIIKFVIISEICGQDLNEDNHWNVSDWWAQNEDFDHKISNVVFEGLPIRSADFTNGRNGPDLLSSATSRFDSFDSDYNKQYVIPKTSTQSVRDTIEQYFTRVRSHLGDRTYYRKIKRNLKQHFVELGLTTAAQSFWPSEMVVFSS